MNCNPLKYKMDSSILIVLMYGTVHQEIILSLKGSCHYWGSEWGGGGGGGGAGIHYSLKI